MALTVETSNARALLDAIRKGIDDGKIETWSYDDDGDFTHTPPQWRHQAWFKPYVGAQLRFGIIKRKSVELSTEVYAVYHGRFSEMLLAHFDGRFSNVCSSAQKQDIDLF